MSKHTPGPWRVIEYSQFGDTRFDIAQEDGAPYTPSLSDVATLICHVRPDYIPIQEANARLIASAPELLEALRVAVRQNSHDMLMTGEEIRKCESAIAKATGA